MVEAPVHPLQLINIAVAKVIAKPLWLAARDVVVVQCETSMMQQAFAEQHRIGRVRDLVNRREQENGEGRGEYQRRQQGTLYRLFSQRHRGGVVTLMNGAPFRK